MFTTKLWGGFIRLQSVDKHILCVVLSKINTEHTCTQKEKFNLYINKIGYKPAADSFYIQLTRSTLAKANPPHCPVQTSTLTCALVHFTPARRRHRVDCGGDRPCVSCLARLCNMFTLFLSAATDTPTVHGSNAKPLHNPPRFSVGTWTGVPPADVYFPRAEGSRPSREHLLHDAEIRALIGPRSTQHYRREATYRAASAPAINYRKWVLGEAI